MTLRTRRSVARRRPFPQRRADASARRPEPERRHRSRRRHSGRPRHRRRRRDPRGLGEPGAPGQPDPARTRTSSTLASRTSGWTLPVLVNSYGLVDNALNLDERHPSLTIAADGTRYCTWQSSHDIDGAGGETDVFAAVDAGSGWGPVEFVNHAADDNSQWIDDTVPAIVLTADDEPLVAWQHLNHTLGDDDILLFRPLTTARWTAPGRAQRNAGRWRRLGARGHGTRQRRQALGGVVHRQPEHRPRFRPRCRVRDFLIPAHTGGQPQYGGISALAASDSATDCIPAIEIVTIQPLTDEIHVVWSAGEPVIDPAVGTTGADLDLAHAVIVPSRLWNPPLNPTFVVNSTGDHRRGRRRGANAVRRTRRGPPRRLADHRHLHR
jgi:hypothetical protein